MFGKFMLRTLVGVLVALPLYLALAPNHVYGVDALSALVFLVICTGGLSLLVIIPACYLIGLLLTFLFIPFGKPHSSRPHRSTRSDESRRIPMELRHPPGSPTHNAFVDYVAWAVEKGRTREQIRAHCVVGGWPEMVVDAEIAAAMDRKPEL